MRKAQRQPTVPIRNCQNGTHEKDAHADAGGDGADHEPDAIRVPALHEHDGGHPSRRCDADGREDTEGKVEVGGSLDGAVEEERAGQEGPARQGDAA